MKTGQLRLITPSDIAFEQRDSLNSETLDKVRSIIEAVRTEEDAAIKRFSIEFDGRANCPLVLTRHDLETAFKRLPNRIQTLLRQTADRIRSFAEGQLASLAPFEMVIPGGSAGHKLASIERAACYAPGGRFPLPSSVLMTVIPAKTAGVSDIWVLTPSNEDVMFGAAYVAGANSLLNAGGAQAVAAAAYGTASIPSVDIIVGPGNQWVTTAKQCVAGKVAIDMLAGPSELVVVADHTANAKIIAADLLAQAEHDPNAIPILVTNSQALHLSVNVALTEQLLTLPTSEIATQALQNGFTVLCDNDQEILAAVDSLAPEHLEVQGREVELLANRFSHYGAIFIGEGAAEVLGDYGIGPNHVLPTGKTSRYTGGLSVFNFLRVRSWMRIDKPQESLAAIRDAEVFAELEGLSGHSRSAAFRRSDS